MGIRAAGWVAWGAFLAGCATAPEKSAPAAAVQDFEALQVVRIETVGPNGPVNARCGVKNDRGKSEILAPGVAEVVRSARPLEILCFAAGYRIAMRSLESGGDVVGPAATGVVTGGAMTAVVAIPLLAVPVFGPLMYMGAVGSGALLGGAVNAADKHSQGKIYSYPPSIVISMVSENAAPGAEPARELTASQPIPQVALPALSAAPAPAAQPFRVASAPVSMPLLPIAHEIPGFPAEAEKAGIAQGTVRAQLAIDAAGNVTAVRIVEARPPHVFDRAVTETLARWKFAGGAADRTFDAEIEFRR